VKLHGFTAVASSHTCLCVAACLHVAVSAKAGFGETRRSIPSFAKATEGYPFRISILRPLGTTEDRHPRVYTHGFLRRRVTFVPGIRAGTIINKTAKRLNNIILIQLVFE